MFGEVVCLHKGSYDGSLHVPTLGTSGSTTGGHVGLYDLETFYGASSVGFQTIEVGIAGDL